MGVPEADYLDILVANLEGTVAQWMDYIDREVLMHRQALYANWQD